MTSEERKKTKLNAWRSAGKLALAAALLVATTAAQAPSGQQAEVLLQQADAALKKEDYAAAAKVLEAYLAQTPQDYSVKFNLALAYSMTGRQDDAIRLYQEVLAQQPDLVQARQNLGILMLQQGNAAQALEQFQQVVDKQPNHWAAQINRAGALVALNRKAEAEQAYERALQLKPDHAPTHAAYGQLLASRDPATAEEHLRRAVELDPSLEDARLDLATVLEARSAAGSGSLEEAEAIYEQFLESHPDRGDVRLRLAEIYLQQKRPVDAIRELEAARAGAPPNLRISEALLDAYVRSKQNDKALALLPELLSQRTGDAELYLLQGSLLMEKRQYASASDSFRRAIELAPQSPPGYTNLAAALYLIKDYQGTVAALDKLAALGKDTAGSYFLRAITLDKLELKGPAYDNYQKFLASDEKKNPDQEFQARQRSIVLGRELKRPPLR